MDTHSLTRTTADKIQVLSQMLTNLKSSVKCLHTVRSPTAVDTLPNFVEDTAHTSFLRYSLVALSQILHTSSLTHDDVHLNLVLP